MSSDLVYLGGRVQVVVGDITREQVDAIVNAANSTLMGGGGVDGAIHDAGGDSILAECEEIRRTRYPRGLPTGEAVATTAGDLPARWVIHTVGPIKGANGNRDAELLASAYRNSLQVAAELGATSIAFPAISTGVYRFPKEDAAIISSQTIQDFLQSNSTIKVVRLVFFSKADAQIFGQHQRFSTGS